MTLHASIADSLINALPSASYGLHALLQLAEITESTSIPTAAIECTRRPRLLINPEFVAKHANTSEKLAMLVMHELHHVILGHTRLYPRMTPLDNLVFDAVINSMLCRMLPERATCALFTDFYSEDEFPECFLRPTLDWTPKNGGSLPAALRAPESAYLADLYARLYSEQGVTYDELREALTTSGSPEVSISLLGDHGERGSDGSGDDDLETRAPELFRHVRSIVARWPQSPTAMIGCARDDFVHSGRLSVPPPSRRSRLRHLLRKVADPKGSARMSRCALQPAPIESPVPVLDRRAIVAHALGQRPPLYRHTLPHPRRGQGGELVHLYVDVSGSMNGVLGPLYRAVLDCEWMMHPAVHLFSTKVCDVGVRDLRAGVIHSTGGTSIECVAQHMQAHRVRRAVIVTDGYVGTPGAEGRAVLERCTVGVALFGPSIHRASLEAFADHWLEIDGGD